MKPQEIRDINAQTEDLVGRASADGQYTRAFDSEMMLTILKNQNALFRALVEGVEEEPA